MKIILDANAAPEIGERTQNGALFLNVIMNSEGVMAPELYVYEISNTMWKYARKDKNNAEKYLEAVRVYTGYINDFVSSTNLWPEALKLATEYDHPVYDMFYAALAHRHNAMLITMDKKLRKICEQIPIRCVKLAGE